MNSFTQQIQNNHKRYNVFVSITCFNHRFYQDQMEKVRATGIIIYRCLKGALPELLLLQTSYNHEWAPPKGHVDPGESDLETAYRETEEEAGIKKSEINLHEDFCNEIEYVVTRSFNHKADTQRQKSSVFFLGQVDYSQKVTLSEEHVGYKWIVFDEAKKSTKFENYVNLYEAAQLFLNKN